VLFSFLLNLFIICFVSNIGPLVTDKTSKFTITPPVNHDFQDTQLLLPTNSFICESASRILFQSIDWIKDNTCFQTLE